MVVQAEAATNSAELNVHPSHSHLLILPVHPALISHLAQFAHHSHLAIAMWFGQLVRKQKMKIDSTFRRRRFSID
jgi:hypothetical protein